MHYSSLKLNNFGIRSTESICKTTHEARDILQLPSHTSHRRYVAEQQVVKKLRNGSGFAVLSAEACGLVLGALTDLLCTESPPRGAAALHDLLAKTAITMGESLETFILWVHIIKNSPNIGAHH